MNKNDVINWKKERKKERKKGKKEKKKKDQYIEKKNKWKK